MQITWILIIINFIVFILQQTGLFSGMGFTPALFVKEPYTILTSMFMHGSLNHLLLNMFGLFMFGSVVEHELGKQKMLIIYFFSGFLGSLGYMIFGSSPFISAVGASGAIFGLIGAAAILKPKMLIWTAFGPLPMFVAALLWGIAEFIGIFGIDTIAQSAHIGGLIGGILISIVLFAKIDLKIVAAGILLPVLIAFFMGFSMPSEIQAYAEVPAGFELNHTDYSFNIKQNMYTKGEEYIFTITSPSRGKFNLAEYSRMLEYEVKRAYQDTFGICNRDIEYLVDIKDTTAIIEGSLCSQKFRALGAICSKNIDVVVIEFYGKTPEINDVVSCT